jgi:hypothetical protein
MDLKHIGLKSYVFIGFKSKDEKSIMDLKHIGLKSFGLKSIGLKSVGLAMDLKKEESYFVNLGVCQDPIFWPALPAKGCQRLPYGLARWS